MTRAPRPDRPPSRLPAPRSRTCAIRRGFSTTTSGPARMGARIATAPFQVDQRSRVVLRARGLDARRAAASRDVRLTRGLADRSHDHDRRPPGRSRRRSPTPRGAASRFGCRRGAPARATDRHPPRSHARRTIGECNWERSGTDRRLGACVGDSRRHSAHAYQAGTTEKRSEQKSLGFLPCIRGAIAGTSPRICPPRGRLVFPLFLRGDLRPAAVALRTRPRAGTRETERTEVPGFLPCIRGAIAGTSPRPVAPKRAARRRNVPAQRALRFLCFSVVAETSGLSPAS